MLAHDLVPTVAKGALSSRIELSDPALVIDGQNAVECRIQNRCLARLAAPQLFLRLLSFFNFGSEPRSCRFKLLSSLNNSLLQLSIESFYFGLGLYQLRGFNDVPN